MVRVQPEFADNLPWMTGSLQLPAGISPDSLTPLTQTMSADELRSFFELCWSNAPGAIFAIDCESGRMVDANPGGEALSGYSLSELMGIAIKQLHPENEREQVEAELLLGIPYSFCDSGFHLQRKDGALRRVAVSSSSSILLCGNRITVCSYEDISDRVEEKSRLSTQNWALSAYAGAALALGRAETLNELKQSICEAITCQSAYALAWIGIAEDDLQKTVRIAAAAGSGIDYVNDLHISWSEEHPEGRGPTGICIRTGKVKLLEDSETAEFFLPWREKARRANIRSSAAIPFSIEPGRMGALTVYSRYPNAFESSAIEVFEHLAGQIGHGIHSLEQEQLLLAEHMRLENLQRQLSDAMSAMVSPIVTAMEMRDPYTSGHQSRVAEIAVAIGREIGWPEERLQGLRIASLVHDIGKISIPSEILTKPGKLTAADRGIINGHPEAGYVILRDVPSVWPIAEIVRQHHEKLDGSGYPFGLHGEAILPEARVLTVADMIEAMASDRPYRRAIELNEVLQELERQAGSLLDAEAVRVCVALFREKRLTLPSDRHG
ncbi:MAG: HD domain-containing phosphohydrolase [Terracidiphilus sp.]